MELKALLIQGDNYRVFTEDERGREKWRNVERFTFFRILEAAGEPGYSEPNYWTFDNKAIQWDDVFSESLGKGDGGATMNGRDDDNEYDPTYDEWLASLEDETADLEYISDEDWYAELYRSVSMDMGTWR